jgi:hypothetical protein
MGFHINVYNMARINDYKHAREIFARIPAVRGENKSIRRIGDRYEKEKWLRQEIIDGIEVYIAGYYDTDLVRFYPTHKEITLGNYPSTSTQYFVEYIGGMGLYQFQHKEYVPAPFTRHPMVKNNAIECFMTSRGDRLYMNARDWYAFNYDNTPIYPEQFEKPVKYRFDAKQMRELRLPYKKFLKYADTMLKLNNEGVETNDELVKQLPIHRTTENTLQLLADEDKTYLAYYFALRQCQRSVWQGYNNNNSGGSNYKHTCNIGMIKRWLDKMIKIINPQVLVEVEPVTNS